MAVMCLIGFVGRWAYLPSGVARPSSGWCYFASRPVVVATSLVIGATRAPAFGDGILAVAKRGQMTGGAGGLARSGTSRGTGVISDRIGASDGYAPAQAGNSFGPRWTTDRCPGRLPVTSAGRRYKQESLDFQLVLQSGRRVSNPRPSAWEADALPTELRPHVGGDASDWRLADPGSQPLGRGRAEPRVAAERPGAAVDPPPGAG